MAAGAVVGATVVAVGSVVVEPAATGVVVVTDPGVDVEPESRLGRRNHTSAAVTTITASDASTAVTTSFRSRGAFQPLPRFELRR